MLTHILGDEKQFFVYRCIVESSTLSSGAFWPQNLRLAHDDVIKLEASHFSNFSARESHLVKGMETE